MYEASGSVVPVSLCISYEHRRMQVDHLNMNGE
jgi:hypothetical protein